MRGGRFAAVVAELALGSMCAGCQRAPGLLCPDCLAVLHGPATVRSLGGVGGLRVAAVTAYEDPSRAVILAHKERGRLGLARPLGAAMATATVALVEATEGADQPLALVPVPSTRRTVRRRGHDPLTRTARRAAIVLRRVGYDTAVVPALRQVRPVADQVGLGGAARLANLAGAMEVRPAAGPLLAGRRVLVVDDVVTTGATIGEAMRALAAAGYRPAGAAVVASIASGPGRLGVTSADRAGSR